MAPGSPLRALLAARAAPAALCAAAALAAAFPLRDNDTFWHVVAGRWILEHRAVPRSDPFRFTGSVPWVDHEWLFQLLAAGVEGWGGPNLLIVLRMVLAMGLAAILYRAARATGVSRELAVVLGLGALLGARPRLLVRPEIVTLIAVAGLLFLLQTWRRKGESWPLLSSVPLVVVWANAHPGALLAPPLAAAYLLGALLLPGPGAGAAGPVGESGARSPRPLRPRLAFLVRFRALGLPLLLLLALLCTPAGWRIFAVPGNIAAALRGLPGTNPEWTPVWRAPQPALLLAGIALAGLLTASWRRTRTIDAGSVLAVLAVTPLAALSIRHQALFFVVATFAAAEAVAALERNGVWPGEAMRRRLPGWVLIGLACAAAWMVAPPSGGPLRPRQGRYVPGFGLDPGRFPEAAVDRLERWPEVGPLYNDVGWGGYLLWRLYPARRVFLDGRNEVDPELLRRVGRARGDSQEWTALLESHGVDGALVRYDERVRRVVGPAGQPEEMHTSSALLFSPESFALVYWDDTALLFVRRAPERAARLAKEEYRFAQPEDWRARLARAAADAEFRAALRADLERRVREEPRSLRAERLLAITAESAGQATGAESQAP